MPTANPLDRRAFLQATGTLASAALAGCTPSERPSPQPTVPASRTSRMPVLFVGHGSPMNAIEDNAWSRGFAALRQQLPRQPKAILAISAHWYVDGTYVTGNPQPETLHDFGGFPAALYAIEYPARGSDELVRRVRTLAGMARVAPRDDWGLDHGTWSVLVHMFAAADVPVVQLSLNQRATPKEHHDLGRALADLRADDVLLLGSGNIVHNLRDAMGRAQRGDRTTPDWARRFDLAVADALRARDVERLLAIADTADGQSAHPYPDHWWPLLYAAGASDPRDDVTFPIEGFDLGSLSMRAVRFG